MDIRLAVNLFLEQLKVNNFSETTIISYQKHLSSFLDILINHLNITEVRELTKQVITAYIDYINNKKIVRDENKFLSKNTKATILLKIQMYLRFLAGNDYIYDDYSYLFKNISKGLKLPKNVLTELKIQEVLNLPDEKTYLGYRDKVIFELMYNTGLRKKEVVKIDIYDVNFEEKTIFVRLGKGSKDRVVPMGDYLIKYLKEYIKSIRPALVLDNINETQLFITQYGSRFTKRGLQSVMERYVKKVDFNFTCHTFRHCFGSHMLKHGASIVYIQRILGHAQISTTQIYTKIYPIELKKIVTAHHPRNRQDIIDEKIVMPVMRNIVWLKNAKKNLKENGM